MATKKREIYARMACQLRTHDRAVRAETLCPGAMGLYAWMLIQARGEETAGDVLEASALAAWGAPTSFRRKQLEALISVDLVERVADARIAIVKYADHNDGPEEIEANRAATRSRVAGHRKLTHVTRYTPVTDTACNADVPISISISSSLSGSGSSSRSEEPTSSPRAIPPDPPSRPHNDSETPCAVPTSVVDLPPAWWTAACDTVAANVAPVDDRGARWLEYSAARDRKGWATGQRDAVGWLSTVVRSERRNAPTSQRRGTGGGPRGDRQGLPSGPLAWLPTGTDPNPFGDDT